MPYWGLYLKSLGFSVLEISQLIAILLATKIVAPNIWGWIADHRGVRMPIIRFASIASLIAYTAVFWVQGFWTMALMMFTFSFFWNANLPQFEATTLSHLGEKSQRYSVIRLWGSVGFVLTVILIGRLMEDYGAQVLPPTILILLSGIFLFSLFTPEAHEEHHHQTAPRLKDTLKRKEVITLLVVCFLLQASHGVYYAFYSIFLEGAGYSRSLIGNLWALGVIAEIVLFVFMHRLFQRWSAKTLLVLALFLTAIRWWMIGNFVNDHSVIIFAQLLHAASFGLVHSVSIYYLRDFFPGRLQGRGQALYSSLSFGAGGAVGTLYGGYVWDMGGGYFAFNVSVVVALVALSIAIWGLPGKRKPKVY